VKRAGPFLPGQKLVNCLTFLICLASRQLCLFRYCNTGRGAVMVAPRLLELRIHGVSNTAPPDVLGAGYGEIERVAGDDDTGFWRLKVVPARRVITEAYSWGQLTSGRRTARNDLRRALWMMLLPFTLGNVAFWARRSVPVEPDADSPVSAEGMAGYMIRLLCLSLTGGLTLAATGAGVDLVAWQCDASCPTTVPGLGFLRQGWWSEGMHPLAVGLLAPIALLAGLWLLARMTYQYEAAVPEMTNGDGPDLPAVSQMDQATFWCGEGQIRRLALLHLAFGGAVAGATVLGAVLTLDARAGAAPVLPGLLLGLVFAAVVVLVLLMVASPAVIRRRAGIGYGASVAPLVLAGAGLLGTAVYAFLADHAGIAPGPARGTLPLFGGTVSWMFAVQFLAVLAVAGLTRWGWPGLVPACIGVAVVLFARFPSSVDVDLTARQRFVVVFGGLLLTALVFLLPGRRPPRTDNPTDARNTRLAQPVWHGQSAAVLAGLGWLIGVLYAAGVLFRLADYLNAGEPTTGNRKIVVPTPLVWSAAGLSIAALVPVLAAGLAWSMTQRHRKRLVTAWNNAHPGAGDHEKRRYLDVASAEALHTFVEEQGLRFVGWLTVPMILLLAGGVAGGFSQLTPAEFFGTEAHPNAFLAALTNIGTTLAMLAIAGLAAAGFLAYRNDTVRRTIGVIWDIGTFWPRSAHPFAPPCYAERVVPQLVTRMCNLPDSDGGAGIILAGHSQGAVIATATIRLLPPQRRARVFLLTFGTQLNRLYGRLFPAFFAPTQLQDLANRLTRPGENPRWCSFYRRTDPLGYPIDVHLAGWSADAQPLPDPDQYAPTNGEVLDPPIHGHSDYPLDPTYLTTRTTAAENLIAHHSTDQQKRHHSRQARRDTGGR
jgi:hypothetical protein